MAISVQVTPGKRLGANEMISNAKLNLLGTPTIELSGSFGSPDMAAGDYTTVLAAGAYFYAVDFGAPSAARVTLIPAPTQLVDGMCVAFKAANDATGPSTLDIGFGANAVLKNGFQPMARGDWRAGQIVVCRYRLDANIVPIGAAYSNTGVYTLNVIAGNTYTWTPGNNDTSLVNGAQTLLAAGTFTATSGTVTLNGTNSGGITATVVPQSNVWQMLTPSANTNPMWNAFRGASAYRDGVRGLVPAPKVSEFGNFLGGDGKWHDAVSIAVAAATRNLTVMSLYSQQDLI